MAVKRASVRTTDRLKDEVYRQMLRLEAGHSAALPLAVALLHAWMACDEQRAACELRRWLRRVSPLCLPGIEGACRAGGDRCSREAPPKPNRSKKGSGFPARPQTFSI